MAAFQAAVTLSADMVELDVRRTIDGTLAIHHDPHLSDGRVVAEQHRHELPAEVPTLDEALAACAPLAVNIEIKNDETEPGWDRAAVVADDVAQLVERLGLAARVLVSSFDRASIDRLRVVAPALATALLVTGNDLVGRPVAVLAAELASAGHRALHPWYGSVDAALVTACHDAGLAVNTWTVDDPAAMRHLIALGVDGICTNQPDVLGRVLAEVSSEAAGPQDRRDADRRQVD